ncbi:MAG TPA: ASPIC/UnbV domain-containing protein, partial [Pyrinomonadaceae bacterium]|nr:ASPIC/UnbV domain-containing protein [Pyrinomonadaceae bacterium]
TILKNVATSAGHWLELRLIGDPAKKSPHDAIGAIVYVTTGKLRQRQDIVSGGSYASQNDMTVHFGLGAATSIDKLEIKWPGGPLETVSIPGIDRKLTVTQGKGITSR